MGSYLLTVYTRPVAGPEDDNRRWYDDSHLAEVLGVAGCTAARRFAVQQDPDATAGRGAVAGREAVAGSDAVSDGGTALGRGATPGRYVAMFDIESMDGSVSR